jgi:hypothetical protein
LRNQATWDSAVGGGNDNVANGSAAVIAGGQSNTATANYAVIVGGQLNTNSGTGASVGGGSLNQALNPYSTVAGGERNTAGGTHAFVGGGIGNSALSDYDVVVGGRFNTVSGDPSFIGAGTGNVIGTVTTIGLNQPNALDSWIAAGTSNAVFANYSGIGGGVTNVIQTNSDLSFIGGGGTNLIDYVSPYSAIVGGGNNYITNGPYCVIGGGSSNAIGFGTNVAYSAIIGGASNQVATAFAAVLGGSLNTVSGFGKNSVAAGHRAKVTGQGTFAWADSTEADFNCSGYNQFLIRANGGVGINTTTPGAALDVITPSGSPASTAVQGTSTSGLGVHGVASSNGNGVRGEASNGVGVKGIDSTGIGVQGNSVSGIGVAGISTTGGTGGQFVGTGGSAILGGPSRAAEFSGSVYFHNGIGIGNSTPVATLDVVSGGASGGNNTASFSDPSLGPNISYIHWSTPGHWFIRSASSTGYVIIQDTGGSVGIGTPNPDALLSVNGNADKPGGGSWSTFSDARLKDVGSDFKHGLEDLSRINPVHYHYKADNPLKLPSDPDYVGVVAQEVQQVIPEAVEKNKDGYLTVNNDPIIWTMVNAIRELDQKLDAKNAENQELKARLERLEHSIKAKTGAENEN